MPICPQCRSHFHVGAKDQCPECGYCLPQAEARLGYGVVDFPRVLDAAGVLTRDECLELMQFLEKLERKVRPVALCVYLTDRGRREELTEHAHWILNHAQINHRAFGRRDRRLAIEESKMQMSFAAQNEQSSPSDDEGAATPHLSTEPRRHQRGGDFWPRLVDAYYQWFYPTPPPVEKEWMLVLVMDVQLGRACFSWGYRLDAYVNGEELSALIPCAYARFRDKDILGGIKKVMSRATSRLASNAVDINAMIRQDKRRMFQRQMQQAAEEARVAAEAEAAALAPNPVVDATQKMLLAALISSAALSPSLWAEDVPSLTPLPTPEPAVYAGTAATETSFPTWGSDDLSRRASGELAPCSRALFTSPGAFVPRVEVPAKPEEEPKDTKKSSKNAKDKAEPVAEPEPEPVVELRPWRKRSSALDGAHFIDEDFLLSELEARDLDRQLTMLNANKPYHLYLCVMDGSHGQTPEYRAAAYLPLVVEMGQQALLIQYVYGAKPAIEISGQGLSLSATQLAEWQTYLNSRADDYGNARDAMLVATECAAELLLSQMQHMREGGVDDTLYLPQAQLGVVGVDADKPVEQESKSKKDKVVEAFHNWWAFVWILLSSILCVAGYLLGRIWVRRKAQLLETPLDRRLSAEFGSGVSPTILYKERYNKKRQLREAEEA